MTHCWRALPAFALAAAVTFAAAGGVRAQEEPVQILFIHHSCGGQLLADQGPRAGGDDDSGERCIYVSHPNGGGLRSALETAGYAVNEASYGSIVGEDTDVCHWHVKFRDRMDRILRTKRQDALLPEGVTNRVVAFKSCYTTNDFVGEGDGPGDPDDCTRTVANAKAAYRSLLPLFAEHPDVLFITVTAPPEAEPQPVGLKQKIKSLFSGKPRQGDRARELASWLADPDRGWLAGYDVGNVAVFDYYDILTGGRGNWSAYPSHGGRDSHPNAEGNRTAAEAFVPFLQQELARHEVAGH